MFNAIFRIKEQGRGRSWQYSFIMLQDALQEEVSTYVGPEKYLPLMSGLTCSFLLIISFLREKILVVTTKKVVIN